MSEYVVEAKNITKTFPTGRGEIPVPVLRGISLQVTAGEFVAIVGPSGSGKSTLLYCLSGLETVSSGEVFILEQPLSRLSRPAQATIRRDHIGFIFQSYNLIRSLSARDNVALPARLARRRVGAKAVDEALEQVSLSDRASYKPAMLSGGQQQRVAIARVLAMRPDVVFADEPTGALDTHAGGQVLDLLAGIARAGGSVVMVTHDLQAAARADRVVVLRDGATHRTLLRPRVEDVFAALAQDQPAGA
ncbi:ABC transporter ATP-binding protein [Paractinoplanes maris]|uniref:ABC transporter ATP-binding protein n=1 Tax=Paractinoplanes maris TaxID=1734446 RepID=UPI002021BED6|nr:ABC transporter ATP-binding protein [Actinoplanes maris]